MPNGKTHDKITIVTVIIVMVVTFLLTYNFIGVLILTFFYLFSSLMFNGDLDTNSRPYNRWWLFKIIWIPYQLIFSHRSIFTHGILIGTLIRLIYISPLLYFGYILLNRLFSFNKIVGFEYNLYILVGLELGNTIHTISDLIYSKFRKFKI